VNTTLNTLVPGLVRAGKSAVLEVNEIQVSDQGADVIRGNSDDKAFEGQGIYLP